MVLLVGVDDGALVETIGAPVGRYDCSFDGLNDAKKRVGNKLGAVVGAGDKQSIIDVLIAGEVKP